MTTLYKGSITLGQAIPMALAAQAQLDAAVGVSLPDVQARVAGLLAVQASVIANPPTIAGLIDAAAGIVAALQASLTPPVPQLTAIAAALAELQAILADLQASASFSAGFGLQLGVPGIHYYVFDGQADQLGPELASELTPSLPATPAAAPVAGAILLAADAGAVAALRALLQS